MNTILRSRRPWLCEASGRRRVAIAAAAFAAFTSLLGAISPAHADSRVGVVFVNPTTYADAGFGLHQREVNLRLLGDYLTRLGDDRLAPGQALQIEVLDVALAGTAQPALGSGDIRLIRGGADWPRITLRYSLTADGRVLQSGTDTVTDLDYLRRFNTAGASGPLRYEKRMLAGWFADRFSAQATANR